MVSRTVPLTDLGAAAGAAAVTEAADDTAEADGSGDGAAAVLSLQADRGAARTTARSKPQEVDLIAG
jgi:hypothetical protein